MITKVTSENKGLYYALFEKASKALGYDSEEACIKSLDEYFACFDDLALMDKVYQVLPLDEPTFDIDGNTRIINVPAEFKKNGISVKGDQAAEIVYFTIDRYFDTVDLYNDGIAIIVQWETASNGQNTTTGISPVLFKDVTVLADQNKLLFGWAINNTITSAAGSIKFAVRFYKVENQELVFSLSTLTANATINPSLDFDYMKDSGYQFNVNTVTDDIQMIQNRNAWQNTSPNLERTSETPVFELPIIPTGTDDACVEHVLDDQGNIAFHCLDLESDGTRTFSVRGSASDGGFISYTWYNGETVLGNGVDGFVACAVDAVYDPANTYYTKTTSASGIDSYSAWMSAQASDAGTLLSELTDKALYQKINTYTATAVGDYKVKVKNRSGIVPALLDSPVVRIPAPSAFTVEVAEGAEKVILDENGVASLAVTTTKGNEHDNITYTWYKNDVVIADAANASLETEAYAAEGRALVDDTYKVSVVATRNNATTNAIEKTFRVTDAASAPTASLTFDTKTLRPGKTFVLGAVVSLENILSDSLTFTWKKVTLGETEEENDPSNDLVVKTETIAVNADGLAHEPVYLVEQTGTYYCEIVNNLNGSVSEAITTGNCVVSPA